MLRNILNTVQNRSGRVSPCTVWVVQLVGGQVAQVLQQYGPAPGQGQPVEVQRAFHRVKLLFGPHGAVFGNAGGALGIPHLHRGKVGTGQRGTQAERLRKGAFAAGRTTDDQRQHCGVYGAMPPSVKE